MPHRPEEQGSSSVSYSPPRVEGNAAAAIMRFTTSQGGLHSNPSSSSSSSSYGARSSSAGVVTPVVKSKPWIGSSSSSGATNCSNRELNHGNMMPRIDSRSNKSSDSAHHSRSIASLAAEDERGATASALMMVAKAAEREHYLSAVSPAISNLTGTVAASSSSSTVPLKKRKKQTDILRRQKAQESSINNHNTYTTGDNDDGNDDQNNNHNSSNSNKKGATEHNPCHISPVSHSSSEHGMVGTRTDSCDDGTPVRRTNPSATNNSAQSYDSKDLHPSYRNSAMVSKGESTQELMDSSKVHNTAQIGVPLSSSLSTSSKFPSQVVIPHFPTVLHNVLVDKELDGKVIQWLPDGEAWKVIRWDAMRRQVLPKYFADLRDENGSGCGTIDAFLYHLDAWGFDEIQLGKNAGAYRHDLFIRGAQKLCVKMRGTSNMTNAEKLPKTVSPSRSRSGETERSMLQVPMLASVGTADSKIDAQPPNKRPRYDTQGPIHWPYSSNDSPVIWGGQHLHDSPHARAYGMRAATAAMSNPYSPTGSYNIDPRIQLCHIPPTPESLSRQMLPQSQYNPPQVRSGRGALRLATSARNQATGVSSPCTTPSFRNGFPVSNRGKGPRKPAACRTTLVVPTSSTSIASDCDQQESRNSTDDSSSKQHMPVTLSEAQRIGSAVHGVAVAVSRKTKRRLPLAARKKPEIVGSRTVDNSTSDGDKESNAMDVEKKTI